MDRAFIEQRAAQCRILAERADPFIKRRLLDLALRYDAKLNLPPKRNLQIPGSFVDALLQSQNESAAEN